MNASRTTIRRTAALALSGVLSASLLVACAEEAPPRPDNVPTTLAPKPEREKQKKPKIKVQAPEYMLYGASSATAEQIWQQSVDLVHDWTLNPKYMKRHKVEDIHELDGLAKIMTAEGGERWKKQAHAALKGYVKPYQGWWEEKRELDVWVNQLVAFNLMIRRDRGWDNPMLSPIMIKDGLVVAGKGGLGVIFTVSTKFRLIGQGREYRLPTQSVLGLAWVPTEDGFKLDQWWRVYKLNSEKVKGWRPGEEPPVDPTTSGSEIDDINKDPSADPTLYPE